jgi:HSP20 family protein
MTYARLSPQSGRKCGNHYHGVPYNSKSEEKRNQNISSWVPATDIYNTEDSYLFKLEVPGFAKEAVNIEFKDGILTIKGELNETIESDDNKYHWTERKTGSFSRSFRLPKSVDGSTIEATMSRGILEVKVAKPEEKKPQSIDIKSN